MSTARTGRASIEGAAQAIRASASRMRSTSARTACKYVSTAPASLVNTGMGIRGGTPLPSHAFPAAVEIDLVRQGDPPPVGEPLDQLVRQAAARGLPDVRNVGEAAHGEGKDLCGAERHVARQQIDGTGETGPVARLQVDRLRVRRLGISRILGIGERSLVGKAFRDAPREHVLAAVVHAHVDDDGVGSLKQLHRVVEGIVERFGVVHVAGTEVIHGQDAEKADVAVDEAELDVAVRRRAPRGPQELLLGIPQGTPPSLDHVVGIEPLELGLVCDVLEHRPQAGLDAHFPAGDARPQRDVVIVDAGKEASKRRQQLLLGAVGRDLGLGRGDQCGPVDLARLEEGVVRREDAIDRVDDACGIGRRAPRAGVRKGLYSVERELIRGIVQRHFQRLAVAAQFEAIAEALARLLGVGGLDAIGAALARRCAASRP